MTVYVDEVRVWPTTIPCFKKGSCHMTADTLEELHAFARRLGLQRGWFQARSSPHYDLTPARRARALEAGAVFKPAREAAEELRLYKVTLLVDAEQMSGPDATKSAEAKGRLAADAVDGTFVDVKPRRRR